MWSCIILKKNNLVFFQGRSFLVNLVFKNFQLFTIFFSINCFPWIKKLEKYHFFLIQKTLKRTFLPWMLLFGFFEGVSFGKTHDLSFLGLSKNIHKSFLLFSLSYDKLWGSQIFFFWIIPIFFILFEIPLCETPNCSAIFFCVKEGFSFTKSISSSSSNFLGCPDLYLSSTEKSLSLKRPNQFFIVHNERLLFP